MVYGVVYPLLMDRLGKNRKNDEELDKDCVEKEFPLARVKSYINGGGGRKAIVMGFCKLFSNISIIWYFEYIDF